MTFGIKLISPFLGFEGPGPQKEPQGARRIRNAFLEMHLPRLLEVPTSVFQKAMREWSNYPMELDDRGANSSLELLVMIACVCSMIGRSEKENGGGNTNGFQELALLCVRMFPEESDKVERYVGGLPDMIHGSVVASKPKTHGKKLMKCNRVAG
ncbi:hypothetical protein Tco_0705104 [Tanacetum coccineum]|uniref:Uncharacterized protein n=1 Tax=Tanacetum coccineum TaxID=301880 RepID=A0ABQ4Y572_9ASTR